MAGPLAAVERFFERLFERPAARLFHTTIEPMHVQRAIERVTESERRSHSGRVYVPSGFRVLMNHSDLEALDAQRGDMAEQLADGVRAYARAHGYILPARPSIAIEGSPVVSAGDVRVFASIMPPTDDDWAAERPPATPAAPRSAQDGTATGPQADAAGTSVFPVPRPNVPRAWLAARSPNTPVTRVAVRPGTLRIGRARDNDLVLRDERVSRYHGQVALRLGMLVYSDLGSTNGSFVNGGAVTEIALGPGDVLQLGRSTVTIESGS